MSVQQLLLYHNRKHETVKCWTSQTVWAMCPIWKYTRMNDTGRFNLIIFIKRQTSNTATLLTTRWTHTPALLLSCHIESHYRFLHGLRDGPHLCCPGFSLCPEHKVIQWGAFAPCSWQYVFQLHSFPAKLCCTLPNKAENVTKFKKKKNPKPRNESALVITFFI